MDDLTFKKVRRKVDAHIPIPELVLSLPDHVGDLLCLQFFEICQYPFLGAEPDYDFGNTEKERLRPDLEKFALKSDLVAVGFDPGGGFELHPVDRQGGVRRFAIPN